VLSATLSDQLEADILGSSSVTIQVITADPYLSLKDEVKEKYSIGETLEIGFESYLDPFINQFEKVEFYKSNGVSDAELIGTIDSATAGEAALRDFSFTHTFEASGNYSFFTRMYYTLENSNASSEGMTQSANIDVSVDKMPEIKISLSDNLKNDQDIYQLMINEPFGFKIDANNPNGIGNIELRLLNDQGEDMLVYSENFDSTLIADADFSRIGSWVSDLAVLIPGTYELYATMSSFESEKIQLIVVQPTPTITMFEVVKTVNEIEMNVEANTVSKETSFVKIFYQFDNGSEVEIFEGNGEFNSSLNIKKWEYNQFQLQETGSYKFIAKIYNGISEVPTDVEISANEIDYQGPGQPTIENEVVSPKAIYFVGDDLQVKINAIWPDYDITKTTFFNGDTVIEPTSTLSDLVSFKLEEVGLFNLKVRFESGSIMSNVTDLGISIDVLEKIPSQVNITGLHVSSSSNDSLLEVVFGKSFFVGIDASNQLGVGELSIQMVTGTGANMISFAAPLNLTESTYNKRELIVWNSALEATPGNFFMQISMKKDGVTVSSEFKEVTVTVEIPTPVISSFNVNEGDSANVVNIIAQSDIAKGDESLLKLYYRFDGGDETEITNNISYDTTEIAETWQVGGFSLTQAGSYQFIAKLFGDDGEVKTKSITRTYGGLGNPSASFNIGQQASSYVTGIPIAYNFNASWEAGIDSVELKFENPTTTPLTTTFLSSNLPYSGSITFEEEAMYDVSATITSGSNSEVIALGSINVVSVVNNPETPASIEISMLYETLTEGVYKLNSDSSFITNINATKAGGVGEIIFTLTDSQNGVAFNEIVATPYNQESSFIKNLEVSIPLQDRELAPSKYFLRASFVGDNTIVSNIIPISISSESTPTINSPEITSLRLEMLGNKVQIDVQSDLKGSDNVELVVSYTYNGGDRISVNPSLYETSQGKLTFRKILELNNIGDYEFRASLYEDSEASGVVIQQEFRTVTYQENTVTGEDGSIQISFDNPIPSKFIVGSTYFPSIIANSSEAIGNITIELIPQAAGGTVVDITPEGGLSYQDKNISILPQVTLGVQNQGTYYLQASFVGVSGIIKSTPFELFIQNTTETVDPEISSFNIVSSNNEVTVSVLSDFKGNENIKLVVSYLDPLGITGKIIPSIYTATPTTSEFEGTLILEKDGEYTFTASIYNGSEDPANLLDEEFIAVRMNNNVVTVNPVEFIEISIEEPATRFIIGETYRYLVGLKATSVDPINNRIRIKLIPADVMVGAGADITPSGLLYSENIINTQELVELSFQKSGIYFLQASFVGEGNTTIESRYVSLNIADQSTGGTTGGDTGGTTGGDTGGTTIGNPSISNFKLIVGLESFVSNTVEIDQTFELLANATWLQDGVDVLKSIKFIYQKQDSTDPEQLLKEISAADANGNSFSATSLSFSEVGTYKIFPKIYHISYDNATEKLNYEHTNFNASDASTYIIVQVNPPPIASRTLQVTSDLSPAEVGDTITYTVTSSSALSQDERIVAFLLKDQETSEAYDHRTLELAESNGTYTSSFKVTYNSSGTARVMAQVISVANYNNLPLASIGGIRNLQTPIVESSIFEVVVEENPLKAIVIKSNALVSENVIYDVTGGNAGAGDQLFIVVFDDSDDIDTFKLREIRLSSVDKINSFDPTHTARYYQAATKRVFFVLDNGTLGLEDNAQTINGISVGNEYEFTTFDGLRAALGAARVSNYIDVKVTDGANSSNTNISISLISPEETIYSGTTVNFKVDAKWDGKTIKEVKLFVDDNDRSIAKATTTELDGSYQLEVTISDNVLNKGIDLSKAGDYDVIASMYYDTGESDPVTGNPIYEERKSNFITIRVNAGTILPSPITAIKNRRNDRFAPSTTSKFIPNLNRDSQDSNNRELKFPLRSTFYYPWHPNFNVSDAGQEQRKYIPESGEYVYNDEDAIANHLSDLNYAKIDMPIMSWWGNYREDKGAGSLFGYGNESRYTAVKRILDRTSQNNYQYKWAFYYEKEGFAKYDNSVAGIEKELDFLFYNFRDHPAVAKLGGKIVLFVYNAYESSCNTTAKKWMQEIDPIHRERFHIVLKVFGDYKNCEYQPDGWHQYGMNKSAQDSGGEEHEDSYLIFPGYWESDHTKSNPLYLERSTNRFKTAVDRMSNSGKEYQLIISYNEWGEGSSIEPTRAESYDNWGDDYLNILHDKPTNRSIGDRTPEPPSIIDYSISNVSLEGDQLSSGKDNVLEFQISPAGLVKDVLFKLSNEPTWETVSVPKSYGNYEYSRYIYPEDGETQTLHVEVQYTNNEIKKESFEFNVSNSTPIVDPSISINIPIETTSFSPNSTIPFNIIANWPGNQIREIKLFKDGELSGSLARSAKDLNRPDFADTINLNLTNHDGNDNGIVLNEPGSKHGIIAIMYDNDYKEIARSEPVGISVSGIAITVDYVIYNIDAHKVAVLEVTPHDNVSSITTTEKSKLYEGFINTSSSENKFRGIINKAYEDILLEVNFKDSTPAEEWILNTTAKTITKKTSSNTITPKSGNGTVSTATIVYDNILKVSSSKVEKNDKIDLSFAASWSEGIDFVKFIYKKDGGGEVLIKDSGIGEHHPTSGSPSTYLAEDYFTPTSSGTYEIVARTYNSNWTNNKIGNNTQNSNKISVVVGGGTNSNTGNSPSGTSNIAFREKETERSRVGEISVDYPTNQKGDILILTLHRSDARMIRNNELDDWTKIVYCYKESNNSPCTEDVNHKDLQLSVYYRAVTGNSLTGSLLLDFEGTKETMAIMASFSGVDLSNPIRNSYSLGKDDNNPGSTFPAPSAAQVGDLVIFSQVIDEGAYSKNEDKFDQRVLRFEAPSGTTEYAAVETKSTSSSEVDIAAYMFGIVVDSGTNTTNTFKTTGSNDIPNHSHHTYKDATTTVILRAQ